MDKIGRYQLLKQIGHGAMGVVYKAMDPSIERMVAVKTMSADLDTEPELRARFFREARSAGQLSHKNIVTIYDLGEEGGKAYMAMEFLDGEDIKQLIGRGARIPIESKLEYMIEVMEGLGHAHSKGIFHRDIKPGNIYVTNTNQIKILDFGLARMASSEMTKTGLVMGTPNYMSPEQINGAAVDHRSDIFSAGATFYELLTFKKPFYSTSLQSTFFKILQEDPEPVENIDPSIPSEFSAVLLRAMAKDPAARYQSAQEMLQALERFPKMLEQRRRKARQEAKRAVEKLESFVKQNIQVLGESPKELTELMERLQGTPTSRSNDETVRTQSSELGLLDVLDIRDKATREQQELEARLQKQNVAGSLLRQAESLEGEGELTQALDLVDRVRIDLPENEQAAALAARIRKTLSEREQDEAQAAIDQLQTLIAENHALLQAEEHLQPDDLKAAVLSGSARAQTTDADATALVGGPAKYSEVLQIRDKARKEFERLQVVIVDQKKVLERVQAAVTHENAGRYEEALGLAKAILSDIPRQVQAEALVQRVGETLATRAREQERKQKAAQLLQEARDFHGKRMFSECLRRLEETLALEPQNAEAQTLRQQVAREIEDEKRKLEQIRKASELVQKASMQFSANDFAGARKNLSEALALAPDHAEAVSLLAEVERANQADLERKRIAEAAANLARQAFADANLGTARTEAERALSTDPENASSRATLAEVVQAEGKLKTLLQEARASVESQNDEAAAAKVVAALKLDRQCAPALELKKGIDERRAARERDAQEKKDRLARTVAQAREAMDSRHLDKARDLVHSVLSEEPAHAEAQQLLKRLEEIERIKAREELERKAQECLATAYQLAKREDFDGAVLHLEKADPSIASQDAIKQALDRYRKSAKTQREAREKAERETKDRFAKVLTEARKAQGAGELEKARTLVSALVTDDSAHAEAKELLKTLEDAIQTRKQQEEIEKKSRELLSQAEALAAQKNFAGAVTCLQKAEPAVAAQKGLKQKLEQYQSEAKAQEEANARARRIQEHLDAGKKAFAQKDFAACERAMDQVLALEPANAEAQTLRNQARVQLEKQREDEKRARELAEAIKAASQSLDAGKLEAARAAVVRAQAIDAKNADVVRLEARISQREEELRKEEQRLKRVQELLAGIKAALDKEDPDKAATLLAEAVTLGADKSEVSALKKKIDKQQRRSKRQPDEVVAVAAATAAAASPAASPAASALPAVPAHKSRMVPIGIGAAAVLIIGLAVFMMRGPKYDQQIQSAQTFIQQKDFNSAINVLQQVPQSSPQYTQAQDLMTQARQGERTKNIEALVAQATDLRKSGQNDKSLAAAQEVLKLDPANAAAKSLRGEIQSETFKSASNAQQDQIVSAALAKGEELYKAGDFEGAREKADEVTRLRPNDPAASNLKQRLSVGLEAMNRANSERSKTGQARSSAESAGARERATDNYQTAQRAEEAALRQQTAKQFDQAAKSFLDATRLYGIAETNARAATAKAANDSAAAAAAANAQRIAAQRGQAETARTDYDQIRVKAQNAGADTKAAVQYQAGVKAAADGQTKYSSGDFVGARGDFENAAKQMQQAADNAQAATQAAANQAAAAQAATAQAARNQAQAAQTAATQKADDERAIQGVLDRYKAAYEKKDLSALRSIFPAIGGTEESASTNNFRVAKTIQLQLRVTGIQISTAGDTATVTSRYQIAIVTTDNQRQNSPETSVEFGLRKANGGWVIQRITR